MCLIKETCKTCCVRVPPRDRFNKEVHPTRSLNLNSELTYREMGEFSVSERLNCVSSFNSEYVEYVECTMTMKNHDQWSAEITIHHGNSTRQKKRPRTSESMRKFNS